MAEVWASIDVGLPLADVGTCAQRAERLGFDGVMAPDVMTDGFLAAQAAIAAANGLGAERALRAITLEPARLLEVADDYGSVEVGKVADLVLFDGDPFEYTSHVLAVVSAGAVIRP